MLGKYLMNEWMKSSIDRIHQNWVDNSHSLQVKQVITLLHCYPGVHTDIHLCNQICPVLTGRTYLRHSQPQLRKTKIGKQSQRWNMLHLLSGLLEKPKLQTSNKNTNAFCAKWKSSIYIFSAWNILSLLHVRDKTQALESHIPTNQVALVKLCNVSKPQFPQQ